METKELLKKVRAIEIKTRGLSRQVFAGEYHSAYKGKGMAFSEVREYQVGDPIKDIDWHVTARFDHPYIKVFEEERELTVMLLIDMSGSRNFGTRERMKKDIITEIAAVLSFSAIQNNDKIGVIFFTDKIEKFISPQKGRKHILRIIREMLDFEPDSTATNLSEALRYLTNVIKKRCTAFILSDFMDTEYLDALRIASNKHDLAALHIYDHRETELPSLGLAKVLDAETGESMWVDTANQNLRQAYAKNWQNHLNQSLEQFRKSGVDYTSIRTDQDYVNPLIAMFKRR